MFESEPNRRVSGTEDEILVAITVEVTAVDRHPTSRRGRSVIVGTKIERRGLL